MGSNLHFLSKQIFTEASIAGLNFKLQFLPKMGSYYASVNSTDINLADNNVGCSEYESDIIWG